jgi:hypothetical protein
VNRGMDPDEPQCTCVRVSADCVAPIYGCEVHATDAEYDYEQEMDYQDEESAG